MMFYGLTLPDLIILVGYFVIVIAIAIGVIASRFIKNREDFIMGGRRFGKLMTVMFTFATSAHADNAVGVASQCYKVRSFAGFWYQGVMIFTLPLYWLLSPIFRRAGDDHGRLLRAAVRQGLHVAVRRVRAVHHD